MTAGFTGLILGWASIGRLRRAPQSCQTKTRPFQPWTLYPATLNRKSYMNVLVTGGAGFIGSAVCRQLVASRSVSVVNVDKLTYAANPRSLDSIANDARYA